LTVINPSSFYNDQTPKSNEKALHLFGENSKEFKKFDQKKYIYFNPTQQDSTQAIIRGKHGFNNGVPNVCPVVTCVEPGTIWKPTDEIRAKEEIDISI
tara:strand:- start:13 stop:306 length:294 start_codon:yes stop_codon:yes gene_type:complete